MAAVRRRCGRPEARSGPGTHEPSTASLRGSTPPPPETLALACRLGGAERPVERCPREDLRRDIVQIEVDLGDDPDVLAGGAVDRDHRLDSELEIAPEPDDAGIDGARRIARARPVQGRLERELDERDHAIEGSREPDVPHE